MKEEAFKISGDQLVKNLKGSTLSNIEKIELANKVLDNENSTTLTDLEDFLLEWCIQLLIRTTKYHTVKIKDTPFINVDYWIFFNKVVNKISQQKSKDGINSSFLNTIFSKLPFVSVVSHTLNYICKGLEDEIKEEDLNTYFEIINTCIEVFINCSKYLEAINVEQLIKLFLIAYQVFHLVHLYEVNNFNFDKLHFLDPIFKLSNNLSKELIQLIKWSSNYKKQFQLFIEQLLLPIIKYQYYLKELKIKHQQNIIEDLNKNILELINISLFHPDYILDYSNISSNVNQSYRHQLFDAIQSQLINIEYTIDILDILPYFIDSFINNNPSRPSPNFEFSFIENIVDMVLKADVKYKKNQLVCLANILDKVVKYELYQPSNEVLSNKQMVVFNNVKQYILSNDLENLELLPATLLVFKSLIKIDYIILEENMPTLWKIILFPKDQIKLESSELALTLIEEYHKARLWDNLFGFIIDIIKDNTTSISIDDLLFWYAPFATKFNKLLSGMNSVALNTNILNRIYDAIVQQHSNEEHIRKKKKVINNVNNNTINLIIMLVHTMQGFPKVSVDYNVLLNIFNNFIVFFKDKIDEEGLNGEQNAFEVISNIIEDNKTVNNKGSNEGSNYHFITATLYFITNFMDYNPKQTIEVNNILSMIIKVISKESNLINGKLQLYLLRYIFQILDFSYYDQNINGNTIKNDYNEILNCALSIIQFNNENIKEQLLTTLLGPWFPLVIELANDDQLQLITDLILQQDNHTGNPIEDNTESKDMIFELLMDASFYELKKLQPYFINNLFNKLHYSIFYNQKLLNIKDQETSNKYNEISKYIEDKVINKFIKNDKLSLNLLQNLNKQVLILCYLPEAYLDSIMRSQLFLIVYAYQKLIIQLSTIHLKYKEENDGQVKLQLQFALDLSLSIILNLISTNWTDTNLIRNDANYLEWLFLKFNKFLFLYDINDNNLMNKFYKVMFVGLRQYLTTKSQQSNKNKEIDDNHNFLKVLLNKATDDKDSEYYSQLCRQAVVQTLDSTLQSFSSVTKLQCVESINTIFSSSTTLLWNNIKKQLDNINSNKVNVEYKELRKVMDWIVLYNLCSQFSKDNNQSEKYRTTIQTTIELYHKLYSKIEQDDKEYTLNRIFKLHTLLLNSYPPHFLPTNQEIKIFASLILVLEYAVDIRPDIIHLNSTKDTLELYEIIKTTIFEFTSHLNSIQWEDILNLGMIRLLDGLNEASICKPLILFFYFVLAHSADGSKRIFGRNLNIVIDYLCQALSLASKNQIELCCPLLEIISKIVFTMEFTLHTNEINTILSTLEHLPILDFKSEQLHATILAQIMRAHTSTLEDQLPQLIRSIYRLSCTPDHALFQRTMQSLPLSSDIKRIKDHLPYLLYKLLLNYNDSNLEAYFYIFDAMYPNDPEQLLSWLDNDKQYILKSAYKQYVKKHKFDGKV